MDAAQSNPDAKVETPATPMMVQYLEIKKQHPQALLLYRMGDFYEMFFEDAEKASATLGIALTKRGKHDGLDIPMCGVPVHALDHYLQKLIRHGHRAAIAEQMEDPAVARKRGSKSVVARDVVRLITPGTLTEDALLDSGRSNYLACLTSVRATGEFALSFADISTGELGVMATDQGRLATDLARLSPSELLVNDAMIDDANFKALIEASAGAVTPVASSRFDSVSADHALKVQFQVETLDVYGAFRRIDLAALGALIDYIKITQVGRLPHMRPPRLERAEDGLAIDTATRNNLELSMTMAGLRKGSLLDCLDMTVTAAGARLLADFVARPLADPVAINARLEAVEYFYDDEQLCEALRPIMRALPDMERALGRLSMGRGGPRDLAVIATTMGIARQLLDRLRTEHRLVAIPQLLTIVLDQLHAAPHEMGVELGRALADDLPILARDGGFIAVGYSAELDEQRGLRDDTKQVIAALQGEYAAMTGLKSLKIKHNNVLGYFIEMSPQQAENLRSGAEIERFMHRQTTASAVRFSTVELGELEQKIALAGGRAVALELECFRLFAEQMMAQRRVLSQAATGLAALDVFTALAALARKRRFVKPTVDASLAFEITAGRHPVVEHVLKIAGARAFAANDSNLSAEHKRLWLLTGPNMAGKSTYLRQNALITIMAQMGSFVPAQAAHIGVVDRLFSRVGAADDLARGRSTFMVEMIETATILNQATPRSLVILDEIGRGTATYDGLSIAWATLEHLHDVNCSRALFATHYHELTSLAVRLDQLYCATMKVKDWKGDIVFLHEVIAGAAERSYGIQAAKLAGLPTSVIDRATEVLKRLEQGKGQANAKAMVAELPLFASVKPEIPSTRRDELRAKLAALKPDEISPREALSVIYELKMMAIDDDA